MVGKHSPVKIRKKKEEKNIIKIVSQLAYW